MDRKNTGTKRLKTERLVLRKILPHDFIFAAVWYTRAELARFTSDKKPFNLGDVRRLTITHILHYDKNHFYWSITKGGRMIGLVELKPMKKDGSYNLHYKLDEKFRGKGFATEAVKAVLSYAKTQDINTIYGHCDMKNQPSYRVMKRAGMEEYTPKSTTKMRYNNGEEVEAYFFRYRLGEE